ncbi:MAG: TAXI family TRAP transporter solute-binding subunit [Syntrophales bacterium LBB04]|nr:TAXI family TRAP transporter solute-binding subunit [Syntrophales bacterium LBB04]
MKSRLIAAVVCIGIIFFCSPAFSAGRTVLPIYTPGAGGSAYLIGGAMASVLNKYIPEIQMMVEATGGTAVMVKFIAEKAEKNQAAFGIPESRGLYMAYSGQAPFTKALTALRALTFVHSSGLPLLVPKNSTIKSYNDLKGKRVGVGAAGSGLAQISATLLEAYGLTPKMYRPLWLGHGEVIEGLQDGSIDAGFISGGHPIPAVQQLAMEKDIRIVPVDEDVLKKILQNNPYFFRDLIKANTYKGVTQDVPSLGFGTVLASHSGVPQELIYKITKTLYEHRDELAAIAPYAREMTLKNALSSIAVPLHSGAAQYYKEMGVK